MRSRLRFLLVSGLLAAGLAQASPEKDFLAAREAFQKGRSSQIARLTEQMPDRHPLRVYLLYWQLKGRPVATEELLRFAADHPDTPLSERLYLEVARFHGKNENWSGFRQVVGKLAKRDLELQCFELRARLAEGDAASTAEALALWHSAQDLPSSCTPLFTSLDSRGALTAEARIARLRLALEAGNLRLAREILAALPAEIRPEADLLNQAQNKPDKLLEAAGQGPAQQELQLHALAQLAKADPDRAARLWEDRLAGYPEAIQQHGWGIVAMAATRQLNPAAVTWYMRAHEQLSDTQRTWRIRAMLRAGRWLDVFQSIVALPPALQDEAVWRYWKARALQALKADFQANQLFAQLSRELHYYGLLAYEELPVRVEKRQDDYRPTPEQMTAAETNTGLARALSLRKLGLQADAVAEWEWALRGLDDHGLLAAAELARRSEWYDRAIITAERTREIHSIDLRYLTPYLDLAEAQAKRNDLDPAWVYGLMRQESRFVDYARSRVGAQGLMQIMPATAKWIARKLGLDKKAHDRIGDPEANIRFGTYYLKQLQDSLGGSPVLATAGYNAGPGRARKWQADTPLEGAIYAETIPFTETREYVKKVLANAMHYSRRLGLPARSLKERLGLIPARTTAANAVGNATPQP